MLKNRMNKDVFAQELHDVIMVIDILMHRLKEKSHNDEPYDDMCDEVQDIRMQIPKVNIALRELQHRGISEQTSCSFFVLRSQLLDMEEVLGHMIEQMHGIMQELGDGVV